MSKAIGIRQEALERKGPFHHSGFDCYSCACCERRQCRYGQFQVPSAEGNYIDVSEHRLQQIRVRDQEKRDERKSVRELPAAEVFMKSRSTKLGRAVALFLAILFLRAWFLPDDLLGQAPFYQGKTITLIQGREAGGSGDMSVRAVIPYLQKYIPGNPTVVTEFIPGAGGRRAANHLYRSARPDGLTIANIGGGLILNAVLGEPGVQYDLDKFIYLGTSDSAIVWVFLTRKEAGLGNLEKLRSASNVRIGAQSVGHIIYVCGRLFAYLLGMKDEKFVTGYSGPELDVALNRGEVDARANIADTLLKRTPEFLERGLVDLHATLEAPRGRRHPRFAHLAELESFVQSDKESKVLAMFRAFRVAGSPYLLPPGTPKQQVEILQEAMRKIFKDPEFHRDYKKMTGEDSTPVTGDVLEKTVREVPRDSETVEFFKKFAAAGPLPQR
jgi:tripartite-type tricarboxylate transporter receptor subunit TctC